MSWNGLLLEKESRHLVLWLLRTITGLLKILSKGLMVFLLEKESRHLVFSLCLLWSDDVSILIMTGLL